VVGPEAPLVAGLVDAFEEAGLSAFGPTGAAAQLEGSKAFSKRFMIEEGIPSGVGAIFHDYDAALAYLRTLPLTQGIVVKASGLAAGKGVFVCSTLEEAEEALHKTMVERVFGDAGDEVLIEDCLVGEEASLLAFSDGKTVVPMIPARDYKRVGDGDAGPNTGGMGCYAPSPYLPPELVAEAHRRVLQPTIDGMRGREMPYVGVLYAGLMLTERGPQVLEFNVRFGDPENQALLPRLEDDLVDVLQSAIDGSLEGTELCWSSSAAVCIVMASGGYPGPYEKGKPITGLEDAAADPDVLIFHAGTKLDGDTLVTAGGRVLGVTARGRTLESAIETAYNAVEMIHFESAHYRKDIGAKALH
jgi:phosphoribosylamine--glycine ligase